MTEHVKFTQSIEVQEVTVTWDLFWSMVAERGTRPREDQVSEAFMAYVNSRLSEAAKEAIEKGDHSIWEKVADRYADYGAADTEPRAQFADIWCQVYGDHDDR